MKKFLLVGLVAAFAAAIMVTGCYNGSTSDSGGGGGGNTWETQDTIANATAQWADAETVYLKGDDSLASLGVFVVPADKKLNLNTHRLNLNGQTLVVMGQIESSAYGRAIAAGDIYGSGTVIAAASPAWLPGTATFKSIADVALVTSSNTISFAENSNVGITDAMSVGTGNTLSIPINGVLIATGSITAGDTSLSAGIYTNGGGAALTIVNDTGAVTINTSLTMTAGGSITAKTAGLGNTDAAKVFAGTINYTDKVTATTGLVLAPSSGNTVTVNFQKGLNTGTGQAFGGTGSKTFSFAAPVDLGDGTQLKQTNGGNAILTLGGTGTLTLGGVLTIANGATLDTAGCKTVTGSYTIANTGTLSFATLEIPAGTVFDGNGASTLRMTLKSDWAAVADTITLGAGTYIAATGANALSVAGALTTSSGGLSGTGTITYGAFASVPAKGSLAKIENPIVITPKVTAINTGSGWDITDFAGTITFAGGCDLAAGQAITLAGSKTIGATNKDFAIPAGSSLEGTTLTLGGDAALDATGAATVVLTSTSLDTGSNTLTTGNETNYVKLTGATLTGAASANIVTLASGTGTAPAITLGGTTGAALELASGGTLETKGAGTVVIVAAETNASIKGDGTWTATGVVTIAPTTAATSAISGSDVTTTALKGTAGTSGEIANLAATPGMTIKGLVLDLSTNGKITQSNDDVVTLGAIDTGKNNIGAIVTKYNDTSMVAVAGGHSATTVSLAANVTAFNSKANLAALQTAIGSFAGSVAATFTGATQDSVNFIIDAGDVFAENSAPGLKVTHD